jgi:hypothetical protein
MDMHSLSRRTLISGLLSTTAGSFMLPVLTRAQATPGVAGELASELHGVVIAWNPPWQLDPSQALTQEVDILNSDTEEVVGSFTIDSVWLENGSGAHGAIYTVTDPPSRDVPTSWNWNIGWNPEDGVTNFVGLEDAPDGTDIDYGLAYLDYRGVPCGQFFTSRSLSEGVSQQRWFGAPIATFAEQFTSFETSVTIDGNSPFPGVDPTGLQAQLESHAVSLSATPEATPES